MNLDTYRSLIEQHASAKDIDSVAATDVSALCALWNAQYLQLYELLFGIYYRTTRYNGPTRGKDWPGDPSKIPQYWIERLKNMDNVKIPFTSSEIDTIRKDLCARKRIEGQFKPVGKPVETDSISNDTPLQPPVQVDCVSVSQCQEGQECIDGKCQIPLRDCAEGETPYDKCPKCAPGQECQTCTPQCIDEDTCSDRGYTWENGSCNWRHPIGTMLEQSPGTMLETPPSPLTQEQTCWPFATGTACAVAKWVIGGTAAIVGIYFVSKILSSRKPRGRRRSK